MSDVRRRGFYRSAARIACFSSLSYVVDYSFQLVDIFWAARLDAGAPTAIAVVSSVFFLILAANEIVGVSTVPIFSQAAGSGDLERTGFVILQALIVKLCLGILMVLVFAGFMLWGASLYRLDAATAEYFWQYARIIWISLVLVPVYSSMMTALRTIGEEAKTSLISLAALLLNVVLNPVLIFGVGGFDGFGLAGAAWATVVAQAGAMAAAAWVLSTNRLGVAVFERRHLGWDGTLYRNLGLIGLPIGGVMILYNLEQVAVTAVVTRFSTEISDGFGIGARIIGFLFMGIFGISVGASITVGHHVGRGESTEVLRRLPRFAFAAAGLLCVAGGVIVLNEHRLMRLFTDAPATIAAGAEYLRYMVVALCFLCLLYTFTAAFEGVGRNGPVLAIAVAMYLGVELPLATWALFRPGFVLHDLWLAIVVASASGATLACWLFQRRLWMPTGP